MNKSQIIDLMKDLGKTVVEVLDHDADVQCLEDEEYIARLRKIIEALAWAVERRHIGDMIPADFAAEMRAFAREVFVQRCKRVRRSENIPEEGDAAEKDRNYFEKLYGA